MNEEQVELAPYEGVSAVDLFCGIGGLTHGFIKSRLNVIAGIDSDQTCAFAYKQNNSEADFLPINIKDFMADQLRDLYPPGHVRVLVGCAPCQPFSNHRNKAKRNKEIDLTLTDDRYKLLDEFLRLVREVQPEIVSMENVPQVRNYNVFGEFISELNNLGYHLSDFSTPVYCPDYGVPQKRERLVLLASRLGPISLIEPTHSEDNYKTVAQTIGKLEAIADGETSTKDSIHRARKLSETNLKRIRSIKAGQNWTNLSEDLISPCHKKDSGKTFTSPYSRMTWDDLAPTMTTHCTGFSNGRFGHPVQDRAISLREAALLQSFPQTYKFVEDGSSINVGDIARHIGNAVPPALAAAIGRSIIAHLISHQIINPNG